MARTSPPPQGRTARTSPSARQVAEWFRQLDHLAHAARAHGADSPQVIHQRESLADGFAALAQFHAPLVLRVSPTEIWLRDELVDRAPEAQDDAEPVERRIPFLLYRDGVRGITIDSGASRSDGRSLADAIARTVAAHVSDENIATLLWRTDLDGMRIDIAPMEAPGLDLSREIAPDPDTAVLLEAPAQAPTPGGETPADVLADWRTSRHDAAGALEDWQAQWNTAAAHGWTERVEDLRAIALSADDGPVTRDALARLLTTWLASAARRGDWREAALAWDCIRRVVPERQALEGPVAEALATLDCDAVTARLDEADRDTTARFFALAVRLGRPAIDLLARVMARSARQRVRASAMTALCYACADDPRALAPYLRDTRWHVARNIVCALGQIGGETVGELLAGALHHPEPRVRRAAIAAFGQVPVHRRTPHLVDLLDSPDPATLAASLAILTREPDPRALLALAERVSSADFESRPEADRIALLEAVGEIGNDNVLPVLERLVTSGGWFARRNPVRDAAARALARIGTPRAMELLQHGLTSRSEAVRTACHDALGGMEKSA